MSRQFYVTIIKAIVVIILVHFLIKRFSASRRLQSSVDNKSAGGKNQVNASINDKPSMLAPSNVEPDIMYGDPDAHVFDNLDHESSSSISKEDLRKSLMDFIDIEASTNITDMSMSNTASVLPQDTSYAAYRPVKSFEDVSSEPWKAVEKAWGDSDRRMQEFSMQGDGLVHSNQQENVCNGGPHMDGVYGFSPLLASEDMYSIVSY